MIRKSGIGLAVLLAAGCNVVLAAPPAVWVTPIKGGEMRFYDWGYSDTLNGRGAFDLAPINGGFGGLLEGNPTDPAGGIGQIQHVVTRTPDRLTADPSQNILQELSNAPLYNDANMDGQVNFYTWGYTTKAGSTFANMRIDYDGDYLVPRNDMNFVMYDLFSYQNEGSNPLVTDGDYPSTIVFQPYALSDAIGWCGSVLTSNPAAIEPMAGQVAFDFGFEVFFNWVDPTPGTGAWQIIPKFIMRSYGTIEIDISLANGGQGDVYNIADAVVNNTNPSVGVTELDVNGDPVMIDVPVLNEDGTPALDEFNQPRTMTVPKKQVGYGGVDPDYYNLVSFMGGGIVPDGAWVLVDEASNIQASSTGSLYLMKDDIILTVAGVPEIEPAVPTDPDTGLPLGKWMYHNNFYTGYTFILRADGIRVIESVDYSEYTDLSNVPNVTGGVVYNKDENGILTAITDLGLDTDGDGFNDLLYDNCTLVANPNQLDTDADGYGNICDADFNNDDFVNSVDLGLFKAAFFTTGNVQEDLNGDQNVNSLDLGLFKARFLQPVGPSAIAQ